MTAYRARCRCGALTAVATGNPVRVSVCHCRDCQRRSGSAFSAQVRFPDSQVTIAGVSNTYETRGDTGKWGRFRFCPTCAGTIAFAIEALPAVIAIPLGAFDDQHAFAPKFSVWESRAHDWVEITGSVAHYD